MGAGSRGSQRQLHRTLLGTWTLVTFGGSYGRWTRNGETVLHAVAAH